MSLVVYKIRVSAEYTGYYYCLYLCLCTDSNFQTKLQPSAWFLTIDTYICMKIYVHFYSIMYVSIYGFARWELYN